MGEWKLFEGDIPHVSTFEFHKDRARAPHVDQPQHRPRLQRACELVVDAADELVVEASLSESSTAAVVDVSDLGCGDGGLLQLLAEHPHIEGRGYDFQPSNAVGWQQRGVSAQALDVFGADRDKVRLGDVAVVTEVLEHLADPHDVVRWIGKSAQWIVASSPWQERPGRHDECHAWAWDLAGYQALIRQGGYSIEVHDRVGPFQLILGRRTS
ncbi:class I SAM-dependent methyltransferase [Streptomyces scabiei]|uniref:Methionine biosynthesis protein MetW n=1 Tax=Streptomyces scabiei TaxID=1930 RepID=A0A117ED29_STRSC|nr:class I SAM-dependent methyltransferase [Streptomyces scabiei]GAQ61893.1 methionine biosynthesis protein MetW [Streptomyces scabiei]